MNESLIKYLAGLLDADGSLSFAFRKDQNTEGRYFVGLQMKLASSIAVDKHSFIDTLPALTGMGTISYYGPYTQFKTWAVAKRADLEMLLPRLIKHMWIKARHWQWLLDTWRELRNEGIGVFEEKRNELVQQCKQSRRDNVGPVRPKNHPTWAWAAGYFDGDGCYSYRKNFDKKTGYWQWTMNVNAVAHVNDAGVFDFLQKSFGGIIYTVGDTKKTWKRSLGYQNRAFALSFLPHLAKHSRLKRHKIDAIIHHLRQRLSVPGTKVQAIV